MTICRALFRGFMIVFAFFLRRSDIFLLSCSRRTGIVVFHFRGGPSGRAEEGLFFEKKKV